MHVRRRRLLLYVLLIAPLAAGCAPRARLNVKQPFAPPVQRDLQLESDAAYWTLLPEGLTVYIAAPLPGSRNGPRCFVLYLLLPAGTGTSEFGQSPESRARGFLIQEAGLLRGKTALVGGRVTLTSDWLQPNKRKLELHAAGEDGVEIIGRGLLVPGGDEIRAVRRQYSGDVMQLLPPAAPATQPAAASTQPEEPARAPTGIRRRPAD